MRLELFYNPRALLERCSQEFTKRSRLRRLQGTCAHWLGQDHIDSMELLDLAAAKGARVFYDIGANVGTWTLLCRALVPGSTIVAFEPMEEHLSGFRANTAGMESLTLLPLALGRCAQVQTFHPASYSDASSFLPIQEEGKKAWRIENTAPREMAITALDTVIAERSLPRPDLLKLDVQGYELEVLRGATRALETCPWVLCEVSFAEFYHGQCLFSEVTAFLAQHGFEVCAFGKHTPTGQSLRQADVLFARA